MLLLLATALADSLGAPTIICPRGADLHQSHVHEYCEPSRCGEHCHGDCEPLGLCVEQQEKACSDWDPKDEIEADCTKKVMVVLGECESDSDCSAGRCMVEDRCVPQSSIPKPACGCSTGFGPSGLGLLLLLLAGRREESAD